MEEREKRVVSLSVAQCSGQVIIEVTNFFDGVFTQSGDRPRTTKRDKGRHGFGIMSMRYVAELYGGSMSIQTQRDIFNLRVSIPIPPAF